MALALALACEVLPKSCYSCEVSERLELAANLDQSACRTIIVLTNTLFHCQPSGVKIAIAGRWATTLSG